MQLAVPDAGSLSAANRQSWPTRVDMHQDIEDSLAASSISHAGGPQSPARSAENLLNGHRSKGLMDLGRRDEATVTDSPGLLTQARIFPSNDNWEGCGTQSILILFLFFFLILQGSAAMSGPATGAGNARVATPSTSAGAKQRTCLFRFLLPLFFAPFWWGTPLHLGKLVSVQEVLTQQQGYPAGARQRL